MFVPRQIFPALLKVLDQFPAVLLTGPRQSGKTTLLRTEFKDSREYVSFDDPMERAFALDDPAGFLDRFSGKPVILDEIQHVPELFQYLKMRIDNDRSTSGRWLLTGSQNFSLMTNVGESLAGRIAVMELMPFSLEETGSLLNRSIEEIIFNGWYPDPCLNPELRDSWVKSYLRTYIERDVRQLQNIKDLRLFETFLGIIAANHSQTLNASIISRQTGVSVPTVNSWVGLLEASYVAFLLRPYFRNFGKRVVKTPKLYLLDSAVASYITRQPGGEVALAGPMGGALFEGFIVCEVVKLFAALGREADVYFWRSHDGLEVDLIVQARGRLIPVEIKLTATPSLRHIEPIKQFRAMAGREISKHSALVCRVNEIKEMPGGCMAIPWSEFSGWLVDKF